MNKSIRILGIAGSLRRESFNRGALRATQQLAPEGATLDVFELNGIPGFNQDEEQNPPEKVVELKRRIREADAILFVTPAENGRRFSPRQVGQTLGAGPMFAEAQ